MFLLIQPIIEFSLCDFSFYDFLDYFQKKKRNPSDEQTANCNVLHSNKTKLDIYYSVSVSAYAGSLVKR